MSGRAFEPHALALAPMADGELALTLEALYQADASPWGVPAYRFDMTARGRKAGTISLRVGTADRLLRYAGQVGFMVEPAWRGRGFATRATRLLLPLARAHGLSPLWLTCVPDNLASRRAIERLGAVHVETVPLPPDYEAYARGEREKRRYRLDLPPQPGAA